MINLFHFLVNFHWPKWNKWECYNVARDADFGMPLHYFKRECEKCGMIQTRCKIG